MLQALRFRDFSSVFSLVTGLALLPANSEAIQRTAAAFDPDEIPDSISEECGLRLTPEEAARYLERREIEVPPDGRGQSGPPYLVAIAPHIVRQSNGTGGLPVSQYEQAMIDANLAYSNTGIVFYTLGSIDFIDSNAFYFDIDSMQEIDALRTTNTVEDAINIYFTPNLKTGPNTAICGISAFTFSPVQAIAMSNSCTATPTNHSTYAHEIGHYFDLFHTHELAFGEEFVDGSNCMDTGDLLCDTPADPGLTNASVDSITCAYVGSEEDSNGDPYDPDARQYLSYSRKHCRDTFSAASEAKIVETLLGPRANLISSATAAGLLDEESSLEGAAISLSAPRPNPTNGEAVVNFSLAGADFAEISIFDVRGSLVRTLARGVFATGDHSVRWNGMDDEGFTAVPGLYFVRAKTNRDVAIQKIQIVR